MRFTAVFLGATVAIFFLTVLAERILIPIFRSHKVGQKILDIGPRWHKSKEGTPTMGGLGFILPSLLVMGVFFVFRAIEGNAANEIPLALTLGFAVANGAIGFVDDYSKLIKHQNEGLTRGQKLVLQVAVIAAYICVMAYTGNLPTEVFLPLSGRTVDLGWFRYLTVGVLLFGIINGANFTDGVDGLASSVVFVIGGFFAVLAFAWRDGALSMNAAVLIGSTLGFLVYNFHPARIFMGDTGSLFLGAFVIASALQIDRPIAGLVLSVVFLIEILSSGLQIASCKLRHGKRIFRMAPLHHHFEKGGWSEYRVVAVFSAAELILCVLAWFLI